MIKLRNCKNNHGEIGMSLRQFNPVYTFTTSFSKMKSGVGLQVLYFHEALPLKFSAYMCTICRADAPQV
jgi:hypothetical protein